MKKLPEFFLFIRKSKGLSQSWLTLTDEEIFFFE